MESSHYRLLVRSRPDTTFVDDGPMLAARLGRIPGVEATGPGAFRFGEPDEDGVMEIERDDGGGISIRVPRAWVRDRGPQVFALVFMVAEWCDGEVFDPQIGEVLRKDVVLQGMVAMRQAQRERETETAPESPAPASDAPAPPKRPWWKRG